jgi:predicted transcriptional regulator
MPRVSAPRPTDAELAVLQVLWESGPCTVRQVHEALRARRGSGYTTTLKIMQIMLDKGLVRRDDAARTHIYLAAQPRQSTQRGLLRDLMDRAFGGSARRLVLEALSSRKVSRQELAEVRRLLDQMENQP